MNYLYYCASVLLLLGAHESVGMPAQPGAQRSLEVTSSAFDNDGSIPSLYTCDDQKHNYCPPLSWKSVPENTKTFAFICQDPDAPSGTFIHWVVFNLPATIQKLPENADIAELGGKVGTNSWGKTSYGGPCPPAGKHRYFFYVYALDTKLNLDTTATADELRAAMQGHILGQGYLMGRYEKKKK